MTKAEFLNALRIELEKHQVSNISEIISDYEEHFAHGLSAGKSELDIVAKLGEPDTIAKAHQTENLIQKIQSPNGKFELGLAVKIILRLIVLAPFNFLVLFIPGAIIFALLTAGWSVSLAFGAVSLAMVALLGKISIISTSIWAIVAGVSGILGMLGLSVIGIIVMLIVSKAFLMMAISYLQWNIKFITEK